MPAMLDEQGMHRWLARPDDHAAPPIDVLKPFDAAKMTAHPVSRAVNSPGTDTPTLIVPAASESLFG